MGYPSCLHKLCILSFACLGFSPFDCDQCEIIEEIYQQSIGAEESDSLHLAVAVRHAVQEHGHKDTPQLREELKSLLKDAFEKGSSPD